MWELVKNPYKIFGTPSRIRTDVAWSRLRRPRPLDDRSKSGDLEGNRTPIGRVKTACPEPLDDETIWKRSRDSNSDLAGSKPVALPVTLLLCTSSKLQNTV
jgi:hypothetical protein